PHTGSACSSDEIPSTLPFRNHIPWSDLLGGGPGMSNGATKAPVSQIVVGLITAALVAGVAGYWAGTQPGGGMAKAQERNLEIFHWRTAGSQGEAADAMSSASKAIKAARPKMSPLALGSKEKWEAAFVLDSLLLEVGGAEHYVKLYKGEVDGAADPAFKTALERLNTLRPYIYASHPQLTWDES